MGLYIYELSINYNKRYTTVPRYMQYPSDIWYNVFYTETRSHEDQNVSAQGPKRVHSACKTCAPFSAQVGVCIRLTRVRSACETRSHEDLNVFASRVKRVRSTREMRLLRV